MVVRKKARSQNTVYPMDVELREKWHEKCREIGIAFQDDLGALLVAALHLPKDAHFILAASAQSPLARALATPFLERLNQEVQKLVDEFQKGSGRAAAQPPSTAQTGRGK